MSLIESTAWLLGAAAFAAVLEHVVTLILRRRRAHRREREGMVRHLRDIERDAERGKIP